MTRRSKRKAALNKKKQAEQVEDVEEVQESPISSQSDADNPDQTKDESSTSLEEVESKQTSAEQVSDHEQEKESAASQEVDDDSNKITDDATLLKETVLSSEADLKTTDDQEQNKSDSEHLQQEENDMKETLEQEKTDPNSVKKVIDLENVADVEKNLDKGKTKSKPIENEEIDSEKVTDTAQLLTEEKPDSTLLDEKESASEDIVAVTEGFEQKKADSEPFEQEEIDSKNTTDDMERENDDSKVIFLDEERNPVDKLASKPFVQRSAGDAMEEDAKIGLLCEQEEAMDTDPGVSVQETEPQQDENEKKETDGTEEVSDQDMSVDIENKTSKTVDETTNSSVAEAKKDEIIDLDETEMETNEEAKVVDKSNGDASETNEEAKTVDQGNDKGDEETDKEPVVIELGTNDDLTDDGSSKSESSSAKKADFQVLDEIDLTKSDDEQMDVDKEKESFENNYVVPDYDDPALIDLDVDPERDGEGEVEETAEFLKYWIPVQDNPQEFTSWTYLLQFTEQNGNLPLARRAFNSFFKRYPLCYGYWKKFSELERKNGNILRAQKILERGVRGIPLSIDLWVHVIDFYINHYNRPDAGIEKTRKIFERAITASGQEFRSEKLWNKYVKWEIENKNWMGIMDIYDKAIRTLTQHYSIIFSDFKSFVNKRSPRDLLTEDEFEQYLKEVRKDLSAKALKKATEKRDETKEGDSEVIESNDDDLDEAPPGVDNEERPVTDDDLKAIRGRIISEKKKVYDETEQAVTKIWAFEEGIKRPYFHVKQLERAQLKNWREYLDFEITREDHDRVVLLFERCLIACALYEDFWLKYTKYMAKIDAKTTSEIFERGCTVHLPRKPNIHVQWAVHEELQDNSEKASKILEALDRVLPGMAMIRMRRVAVARRAGRIEDAEELLKSYVACAAKDKEEVFYTRKLSWFLLKVANKPDDAKKMMKELIPKYKFELKLYNDLVEMEFQCAGADYPANLVEEGLAMEAFNLALSSEKLTDEQKLVFSQRKLEFLEDYGRDVKHLQKVYDEHQKLVRNQKKRTQIDLTADETPNKKQKTDSSVISVVGTSQIANGASTSTTASAVYAAQQSAYGAGDPAAYYQQQQAYWNYASKPSDAAAAAQPSYNYTQAWSQYYGAHR